jgi:hypothetical protein
MRNRDARLTPTQQEQNNNIPVRGWSKAYRSPAIAARSLAGLVSSAFVRGRKRRDLSQGRGGRRRENKIMCKKGERRPKSKWEICQEGNMQ